MPRGLRITQGHTLSVMIRSRETVYFNGPAAAVSSINQKGPFDILPQHAHFISLIQDGAIVRKDDGTQSQIYFSQAILKTNNDRVEIYIGLKK